MDISIAVLYSIQKAVISFFCFSSKWRLEIALGKMVWNKNRQPKKKFCKNSQMKRFCYKSQEYMKSVHTCSNPFPSVDFLLTFTVVRQDHRICHATEESMSNLPILLSRNSFQSLLSPCLDINSLSNSLWNFTNIIIPFSSQRGGRQCCHSALE